jgi:ribosomal protein S12 methylthiotransferase accessory factor
MSHRITLKDAYKGYTFDQDKIISPEETVRRFREKLKAADLDILERTVRIDTGRLDIPVYFSICGKDALQVIGTKKQMGKGCTPQQAEASAVMELAERFSFFTFSRNSRNFFIDQYDHVKEKAIPYEMIALSAHDDTEDAEMAKSVYSKLPLKWTWAFDFTHRREVLVPFDWFYAINEFNGASAGNGVEEALLQGICEVVERHVSSLVARERMKTPSLCASSITHPVALDILGKYEKEHIRLFINDFSLGTGIPTVAVLAYDPSTFPDKSEIVWTAGTTPDPHKALIRALTEVAQLAGDFHTGSNYVASGLPKFKRVSDAEFVMNPGREVDMSDLPDLSNDNLRVEVEHCVEALARRGSSVLAVNVTHPGLGIPAFYTIIPGAHFRERASGTSVGMFCAKLVAENGDPARAVSQLEELDRLLPGKYYTKFFLGYSHLSRNEPFEALRFFEEALGLSPKEEDIPSIYSYLGVCLKNLDRYGDALAALEKAEEHDKERTDIYNLMGFCHFKLKEHEQAIECFKKVLALNPSSAIDYANIASNYRDMGNREQAIAYYRVALELDPTVDFARENLIKLEGDPKSDP